MSEYFKSNLVNDDNKEADKHANKLESEKRLRNFER